MTRYRKAPGNSVDAGSVILAAFLGFILIVAETTFAQSFYPLDKTIVIDPGHGGKDTGFSRSVEVPESVFCLGIARKLAQKLSVRYHVILTRTDDYAVDTYDRANIANQNQARLFISIHSGGNLIGQPARLAVFYYNQPDGETLSDIKPSAENLQAYGEKTGVPAWKFIQNQHIRQSQALAETIRDYFELEKTTGKKEIFAAGIPMPLMEGVDMPAVLIEIPSTVHAGSEKQPDYILTAICRAVDNFFHIK